MKIDDDKDDYDGGSYCSLNLAMLVMTTHSTCLKQYPKLTVQPVVEVSELHLDFPHSCHRSNPTVNIDVNIENNDGVPMQIVEGNLHDGQDGLDEVVRADEHDDQYGGVKSHIMD